MSMAFTRTLGRTHQLATAAAPSAPPLGVPRRSSRSRAKPSHQRRDSQFTLSHEAEHSFRSAEIRGPIPERSHEESQRTALSLTVPPTLLAPADEVIE